MWADSAVGCQCIKEVKVVNPAGKKYPVLMEEEEIAMVGRLLDNGLKCFKLYSLQVPPHLSQTSTPHGHDEKDVIDGFATIFTMMEQRAFREVFTLKMDTLFQAIVDNPRSSLMFIPQHFLGSNVQLQNNSSGAAMNQAQIGRVFADILLTFLVKRLKELTIPFTDSPQSATYVHLFRHVFASVEVNDVVLRPYIGPIVTSILRLVTEVRNPINYFAILRALFRSIGGGKFELLYKEFLPCLTGDHGVLTRSGWRSITTIAVGDEVASFNRATCAMEWKRVTGTQRFKATSAGRNRLFRMQGKGMDVVATADHSMLTGRLDQHKLTPGSFNFETVERLLRLTYVSPERQQGAKKQREFEYSDARAVVHSGLNTQSDYPFGIERMPRVCAWWWEKDRQLGFLRFLGFWLGDGHLTTTAGYSSVGIAQRKLAPTAWLIDLLDEVFPRWWRRYVADADETGITYSYAINCPPLVVWLRAKAAGPEGYDPRDPAQLRKYPHFDFNAELAAAEATSPYRSPRMAGTTWVEAAMLTAFGEGAVRRPCCVCGDASGVRLSCSGATCAHVDAITRAHPACVGRTDDEAFVYREGKKNKPRPWYCPDPQCQEEAAQWSAAHPSAPPASTEDDAASAPPPAKRRRGSESILLSPRSSSSSFSAAEEDEEEDDNDEEEEEDEVDPMESETSSTSSAASSERCAFDADALSSSSSSTAELPSPSASSTRRRVRLPPALVNWTPSRAEEEADAAVGIRYERLRPQLGTVVMLLRDSERCGRQCGGCRTRVWSSCKEYAQTQLVRHIRKEHADQLADATAPSLSPSATAVAGARIVATGVVFTGGVFDIDEDGTWFYHKRWMGPDVADTFANLSQPQAVALLEGFCRADGEWARVQFVDKVITRRGQADVVVKEPNGQWRCSNSSFPLIDHLQLIGQLAGARVDLARHSRKGKQNNKGPGGRPIPSVLDHWRLSFNFTKTYGAQVHLTRLAKPVPAADVDARGNYDYEDDGHVYDLTVKDNHNFLTQRLSMKRHRGGRDATAEGVEVQAHPLFVGNCLPDLVGTLMRMQSKGPAVTREIALELSLTLPARLSSLLPYIPILIRAVLRAFQAKEDTIVKLGLRTLDFWVDNLNPDYLYPHCRPILAELFTGLCALLKPSPASSYGSQALSVLGKFGGKNRRFLIEAMDLQWKDKKEDGLVLQAHFASLGPGREANEEGFDLPMGRVIDVAAKVIATASATQSYANTAAPPVAAEPLLSCYYLVRTCLLALMDTSGDVNAVWVDGGWKKYRPFNADWQAEQEQLAADAQRRKEEAEKEKQRRDKEAANRQRDKDRDKAKRRNTRQKDAEPDKDADKDKHAPPTPAVPPPSLLPSLGDEELIALRRRMQSSCSHATFKTLLTSVLFACADPTLHRHGSDAVEFVRGLCVHFASVSAVARTRGYKEEGREIDSSVFVDAVVECMCEEEQARREVAFASLSTFLQSLIHLVGVDAAGARPIIADLLSHLCHCCHLDRWEAKQAGAIGLALLCRTLSPQWLINAQMELIKALMATFVDDKTEHTQHTADKVTDTLHLIVDCTCQAARDALKGEAREAAATTADMTAESEERKGVESSVMEVLDDEKETVREVKDKEETKEAPLAEEKSSEEKEMDLHMQTDDESKALADATPTPSASAQPAAPAPSAPTVSAASRPVLDERKSPMLRHLIAVVAPCLISNVSAMRAAAQALLSFISRSMSRSLFDLLYPHREHLLQHVYSKGLHQVSIAVRIGHLSAATYLLTLQPHPLVSVKELGYLVKLVMEVVDEEQQLAGNFNSRTGRQQLWTRLRVESLQLMSAALQHEEVRRDPKTHKEWKESIIRVFFRSLLSRTSAINSAAKHGLRQVIEREKIPKDLLQTCLRPILLNLADHRKLTVALLEGLARLLELLSSCFNVTLGEKLLDHLRNFASMESLSRMREEALNDKTGTLIKLKPEEEVKIPLCVIELFHLLPPAPEGKFLEALVASVMKLEEVLPMLMCGGLATLPASQVGFNLSIIDSPPTRDFSDKQTAASSAAKRAAAPVLLAGGPGVSSPYRLPLLKFLNKHPRKSLEYLFRNLHRKRVSALLLSLLKYPEAEPLRRYLFEHQEFLDMWTFHYDKATAEQSLLPPAPPQQSPNQQGQQPSTAQPPSSSTVTADSNAAAPAPPPLDGSAPTPPAGNGSSTAGANGLPPLENPSAPMMIAADGSRPPHSSSADVAMTPADQSHPSGAAPPTSATSAPAPPLSGSGTAAAPGSQPSKESEAVQRAAQQTVMEQEERIIQGINLVHVLSSIQPEFITQRMLSCLMEVWDSKGRIGRLLREEQLPIHYVEESRTLVQCLLTYSQLHRDDTSCLWKLLNAFRLRSLVDFTFLAEHLDTELNVSYTLTEKRLVLRQLLRYVESPGTSQPTKSRAFKHIMRPMIKHSLKARPARSAQAVREEQLRMIDERKAKEDDRNHTQEAERKEAKEADIGAAPAPAADGGKMELDEKGAGGEVGEDAASSAAEMAEATLVLPPVWLEDDLLDTDMTDSIVHTLTAEHLSATQDEVSTTAAHTRTHFTQSDDEQPHNIVNPADTAMRAVC